MNGCSIGLNFPCSVDPDEVEGLLWRAVEVAADYNTDWYLAEWAAGRTPKCCTGCAGVKHRPDEPGSMTMIDSAPTILAQGYASCGGAAAVSIGYNRAMIIKERMDEGVSFDEALAEASRRVVAKIVKGTPPGGKPSKLYFHAVFVMDGKQEDPTKEMRPWR